MADISLYRQNIIEWVETEAGTDASAKDKGDAFCRWCLENVLDLPSDQALDAMEASGKGDHGIDAFIVGEDRITVVQAKYENSHSWSEIAKFHYDMKRILEGKVKESDTNPVAGRYIADIQDAQEMNWSVEFLYITSAAFSNVDLSKSQSLDGYGKQFLFLDIAAIENRLETKQQELPDKVKDKWFELRLSSREILKFADKTAVIAVSLSDMHDFVEKGGTELFASNVRQYLRGSRINSGIRATIQKSPDKFWVSGNLGGNHHR